MQDQWLLVALTARCQLLRRARPKEDDALAKIISCSDSACVEDLCNALGIGESLTLIEDRVTRAEKVSRRVYELRNNIVHYRPIDQVITKLDLVWDKIVSALLNVINNLYDLRGEPFFEAEKVILTGREIAVEQKIGTQDLAISDAHCPIKC
jgi:hypothetical protein